MKDKGISRDVGNPHRRVSKEAPTLGQVTRMTRPVPEDKGEKRRRRRLPTDGAGGGRPGQSEKYSRLVVVVWTATLGVLAIGAIVLVFAFWLMPLLQQRGERSREALASQQFRPVEEPKKLRVSQEEAEEFTKRALKSRDAGHIDDLIDPGPADRAEVLEFLAGLKERDGEITGYQWLPRLDTPRDDIEGVLVTFRKDGKDRNRLALLTSGADGKLKLDFPAFARLATPSWTELTEGRAKSAVVRVYVAADQYYNGRFTESDGWRCYGVASPDMPELMFGYCRKDSPQQLAMEEILRGQQRMSRATIEIGKVEGSETRQYEIKRVIARDWAIGNKDLQDQTLEEVRSKGK